MLIIQLIQIQLQKQLMNGLRPQVNPFKESPPGTTNQPFNNYHSESHTSSHSSFFEATFNHISHKAQQQNVDSITQIKVENPFNKLSPFVPNNKKPEIHHNAADHHQQIQKKQVKNQLKGYYIGGKHIRASSTIRQELFQSKSLLSDPKVSSQYSTQQFEQTLRQHKQSHPLNEVQQSLSPLKLMEEHSPQTKKYIDFPPGEYDLVIQQKDKEIQILKLQLERYRRCQHINKENQAIYKRLVKNIKHQFMQLKAKTETPKDEKQSKSKIINVSETTRFIQPQNLESYLKAEQSYLDDIKTPFLLATTVQSNYILQLPEKQINQHNYHQRSHVKNSAQTNTLTFNGHKQTMKGNYHKKRITSNFNRPKLYENNYKISQPHKIAVKSVMAEKLSAINQKLWDKKSQRTFSCIQSRKSRTKSYMDLSLSLYGSTNESPSHLLKRQF